MSRHGPEVDRGQRGVPVVGVEDLRARGDPGQRREGPPAEDGEAAGVVGVVGALAVDPWPVEGGRDDRRTRRAGPAVLPGMGQQGHPFGGRPDRDVEGDGARAQPGDLLPGRAVERQEDEVVEPDRGLPVRRGFGPRRPARRSGRRAGTPRPGAPRRPACRRGSRVGQCRVPSGGTPSGQPQAEGGSSPGARTGAPRGRSSLECTPGPCGAL